MHHIYVKAFPSAKKEHVEETAPCKLRVFVREDAQENRANRAVRKAIAAHYKLSEKNLRMISGHQKLNKIFEVLP